MDELEWRKQVRQDGFDDISKIEWAPGLFNDMHTHDFKANLFVVSGEMTVKTDEEERKIYKYIKNEDAIDIICKSGGLRTILLSIK